MPQAQDSGTQRMPAPPTVAGEPQGIGEIVAAVLARLPPMDVVKNLGPPPELSDYERFVRSLGPRHRSATLENFRTQDAAAQRAIEALRQYADRLAENLAAGRGLLLLGPSGTGKDHLLVALGKEAAKLGKPVHRISGPELFAFMRDAMHGGEEQQRLEVLQHVALLILSDPVPPLGGLTPYQASVLYGIVDFRWQQRKPTWCSLNVASSLEADERLGAAIVDRLQADAVVIRCCWPSWRRPAIVV